MPLFNSFWPWLSFTVPGPSSRTWLQPPSLLLSCLLSLGLLSFVCLPSAHGQYIDREMELKFFTQADYVSKNKPKWLGPHTYWWLPNDKYSVQVYDPSEHGGLPWDYFLWYCKTDPDWWTGSCDIPEYTCLIPTERVYNSGDYGQSLYCEPEISDPHQHERLKDEDWPTTGTSGQSLVDEIGSDGHEGGYGKVVFSWNWRKHIVHRKLCDSTNVSGLSRETLVQGQDLVDLSREELMNNKPLTPEDINVDVRVCEDNPNKREPSRPEPYDTFQEMSLAVKKCQVNLMQEYDTGHSPKGDYAWTWREYVPEGWFLGQNPGFNRADFMDWCVFGGANPFSPKPFPGISKDEFKAYEVFEDESFGDYGDPDVKRPWDRAENFAGNLADGLHTKPGGLTPAGQDSLEGRAYRKCNRLYNEIISRRRNAFMELCKKEPYSYFDGCQKQLQECRGYREDGLDIGVSQCCTDSHPEYHYHQTKSFEVPCHPIDAAYFSDSPSLARDDWEAHDGGEFNVSDEGGYTGVVYSAEGGLLPDRGFVGSGGILNYVGLGGEPMTVRSDSVKLGSYFWFDLMSGTIGIRSWEERSYTQEVELPATHKKARDTDYWKWGNYIRGSKHWDWFPPGWDYESISNQRAKEDPQGWLYHLFFCERTFTKEELKFINDKWNALPAQLEKNKDIICDDGETYTWSSDASEYRCIPESEAPSVEPGGDLSFQIQSYCALCTTDPNVYSPNACPPANYADWSPMKKKDADDITPYNKCEIMRKENGPPETRAWPVP
jgi:hypothetical protein